MTDTEGPGEGDVQVLTMGRVGVDLYPEQLRVPLADVRTFRKMLGGTATNVAVAAARYGRSSGVITKVGDDAFGPYVRKALREFGVDASRVGTHPTLRTPVVFCEIFPPDDFPLLFYREPTAPDMTIALDELDLEEIAHRVALLDDRHRASPRSPAAAATLAALDARNRKSITVHDLDYRPMFWSSETEPGRLGRMAVERATVVVGGRTEAIPLVGDRPASDTARALLDLGVELAIVKLGPDGVLGATQDEEIVAAADPRRGRQRARRGRCLWRRPLPRTARRMAARADPAVRERSGCSRRISPRVRRRHADGRGGRSAARAFYFPVGETA